MRPRSTGPRLTVIFSVFSPRSATGRLLTRRYRHPGGW
jgi:hypothetical protein